MNTDTIRIDMIHYRLEGRKEYMTFQAIALSRQGVFSVACMLADCRALHHISHSVTCMCCVVAYDCEVCDGVVEDLLEQSVSCKDFASEKKTVETCRPVPCLTNMANKSKNLLCHFSDSWYRTEPGLCGCKRSPSLYCWPCFLSSTERNIWTTNGVSDVTSFYMSKKRQELLMNNANPKVALLKFGNPRI
jgi:hypothetical protein